MDWDVYQEVQPLNADIVAVMDGRIWIIETKRFLNFAVINQAIKRIGFAHWISIGVPEKSWRAAAKAGEITLKHYGIGCITVSRCLTISDVHERLPPRVSRKIISKYVLNNLNPKQRDYCEAGSPGGKAWSPFKDTCERLVEFVKKNPGVSLKEAVEAVPHHYANSRSAKQSLAQWVRMKKIKGVFSVYDKCLKLYPE